MRMLHFFFVAELKKLAELFGSLAAARSQACGMADDAQSGHRSKKAKQAREHGHGRGHKREHRHRDRGSGDEASAPPPITLPWQAMQFQLIDGVNEYAVGRQEMDGSCIVRGEVGSFSMRSFSGLVDYVRGTFVIDHERNLAFRVGVRARSRLVHAELVLVSRAWIVHVCALQMQLQGRAAGVDLAFAARPRREPRPIDRLIECDEET